MKVINEIITLAAVLASTNAKQLPKEGTPKRDVTLTISSTKTEFAADEPVLIDVTLMNNEANKPAKILDYFSPCASRAEDHDTPTEMSFFEIAKTKSARAARYTGALFERKDPTNKDYKILMPGEKITCEVDLGKYYEFDAPKDALEDAPEDAPEDDDDDNEYAITYSVDSMQLSNPSGKAVGQQVESLTSNTLNITIVARDYASPSSGGHALRGHNDSLQQMSRGLVETGSSITFSGGCSAAQQADINTAHSLASNGSTEAIDLVTAVGQAGSSSSCPRYEAWFGSYDPIRHTHLQDGWEKTSAAFKNENVVYDCACNDDSYAYVQCDEPYKINLCKLFWAANDKMEIIIHVMTRFDETANTWSHAYGQDDCKALAISNPLLAIDNGNNYAFIAGNPTDLACDLVQPPCNGETLLTLDLWIPDWPLTVGWDLVNRCTGTMEISKDRSYPNPATHYDETYCVPMAGYEFTLKASYGFFNGDFHVTYEGATQTGSSDPREWWGDTKAFGICETKLTGVTSSASSAIQASALAFDGDFSTRWESDASVDIDTESESGLGSWLQVDLGGVHALSRVEVTWEYASAKLYDIQVSNDNVSFTTVWSTTGGFAGMDPVVSSFKAGVAGRYVRMQGYERATQWAYSIFEMEVYGEQATELVGIGA